jgi:hypothetical protein
MQLWRNRYRICPQWVMTACSSGPAVLLGLPRARALTFSATCGQAQQHMSPVLQTHNEHARSVHARKLHAARMYAPSRRLATRDD